MPIDTRRVILDFHRSASVYEKDAQVQYHIMSHLLELFAPYVENQSRVLDVGCGTGWLRTALEERNITWHLYGIDIAEAMCQQAQRKAIHVSRASADALPFADNSMDEIFSSLCVQWLPNPRAFLQESARILKPGGRVAIATLGQRTLFELREAFSHAGDESRVMSFHSEFDWADMAISEGLKIRHMHSILWKHPYHSMMHLCQSLRAIGAVNKRNDRRRTLTGAALFEHADTYYKANYTRPAGEHKGKSYGSGVWASWQPLLLIFEKS